jgi:hypothetical protein
MVLEDRGMTADSSPDITLSENLAAVFSRKLSENS